MQSFTRTNRTWLLVVGLLAALALTYGAWSWREGSAERIMEGKARLRVPGPGAAHALNSSVVFPVVLPKAAGPTGFTPQLRMGFYVDNEWEPAIAADRFGHVYILYPQYGGVPGCATCYSPTMILQMSQDGGRTWEAPTVIYPEGSTAYQVDAQIAVDPEDGRTVYASWLQNGKSDILVAKSVDFGNSWSFIVADHTNAGTDKPILAVRGQDVYVSYNHSQTAYVTASHDGGASFTQVKMNQNGKLGWSLGSGGTVTPDGRIYFSWEGYENNGQAKGKVNLYISSSGDRGATWSTKLLDVSSSPPDCSAFSCGWAYLGAAITMTSDSAGNLYALWNAGSEPQAPERIYFAASADGGATWSSREEVSLAPVGTHHAFPAMVAAGPGDVRIAWMDARAANGGMDRWNVYYRSSTDGGASWSPEQDISTYVPGSSYIFEDGFRFPFGDYFEMDVDERGTTHAVWGEGYNYDSPGSIWYSQGQ